MASCLLLHGRPNQFCRRTTRLIYPLFRSTQTNIKYGWPSRSPYSSQYRSVVESKSIIMKRMSVFIKLDPQSRNNDCKRETHRFGWFGLPFLVLNLRFHANRDRGFHRSSTAACLDWWKKQLPVERTAYCQHLFDRTMDAFSKPINDYYSWYRYLLFERFKVSWRSTSASHKWLDVNISSTGVSFWVETLRGAVAGPSPTTVDARTYIDFHFWHSFVKYVRMNMP